MSQQPRIPQRALLALAIVTGGANVLSQPVTPLNVSCDVMRAYYKDLDPDFPKYWNAKTGQDVTLQLSHGGSRLQASAVSDGLGCVIAAAGKK